MHKIFCTNYSYFFSVHIDGYVLLSPTSQGCDDAFCLLSTSHDFIGEFTTSFKELCRGQNQLNVYEVSGDKIDQYRHHLQSSGPLCKSCKC